MMESLAASNQSFSCLPLDGRRRLSLDDQETRNSLPIQIGQHVTGGAVNEYPEQYAEHISRAAKPIRDIAIGIHKLVPEGEPAIVLGRDLWPVVPVLRHWGKNVQYFPWSRLQGKGNDRGREDVHGYLQNSFGPDRIHVSTNLDPSTVAQWLREVPANPWVFDTGYEGSILDAIRKADYTVRPEKCRLVSSVRFYKTIPGVDEVDREDVGHMEHSPKIITRSTGFVPRDPIDTHPHLPKEYDTAVHPDDYDDYTDGYERDSDEIANNNFHLLRQLVPDYMAKQYSRFSGVTPRERLGMTPGERQHHYRKVSYSRGKYDMHPVVYFSNVPLDYPFLCSDSEVIL